MLPNWDDRLAKSLAATARELITADSLGDTQRALVEIVRAAVENVPGVDAAGITFETGGRFESRAPFNDAVRSLDELQAELCDGPCVKALSDQALGEVVVVDDLSGVDGDRWPTFAARAEVYGFHSICSIQLSANGGPHAALNLYAHQAGVFGEHARTVASLYGTQAALLLYGADRAMHLEIAVSSRDVIGQAKGILMERYALDSGQAFQMLVRSSQDTNLKLADVAGWLTTNGRKVTPPKPVAPV